MATLIENAAEVATCATAIDAAIVAKGGTTAGGLRNAATGIASIPSGGEETHWWDDLDATIFEIEVYDSDLTFKTENQSAACEVYWDANNSQESETYTATGYRTHTYSAAGKYVVIFKNLRNLQGVLAKNLKITRLIRIESDVTNMYNAFANNYDMVFADNLSLPNATLTAGADAFNNCLIGRDKTLTIPDGFSNTNAVNFSNNRAQGRFTIIGSGANCTIDFNYNNYLTELVAPDLVKFGSSIGGAGFALRRAYLPSCTTVTNANFFNNNRRLKYLTLGAITSTLGTSAFSNIGYNLTADSDGYKSIVTIAVTCADLLAQTNFPCGAPTATKFVCTDGYIAYDSSTSSWVAYTN